VSGKGLGPAALAFGLATLAACGGTPTVTRHPPIVKSPPYPVVSLCYDSFTTTVAELEAAALEKCPVKGSTVRLWQYDRVFNDCPILKKTRASYFCIAPGAK
jgi:hypothetical protein